jgi:hypothetical protein
MQTEELTLDGVPYELRAYCAHAERFASEWRCKDCDQTGGGWIHAESLVEALEFARFSLVAHHQVSHQQVDEYKLPVHW